LAPLGSPDMFAPASFATPELPMNRSPTPLHAAVAAAFLSFATTIATTMGAGAAAAQGTAPNGTAPNGTSDRVTAAIVVRELRAMGYTATVSADGRGEPRVSTTVDNYKWVIFFYVCSKTGDLDQRPCLSLQFFSGYTMDQPVSTLTMNVFNAKNRYIRAYVDDSGAKTAARVSMDVMFGETGADPARNFRAHFKMMRLQTTEFRKTINFK
jgi:hypothetical protein